MDTKSRCTKKKGILAKRVRELRHAVRTGKAVPRAVERVRQARIRTLEARLARLPPAGDHTLLRQEMSAEIRHWSELSPARVLTAFRVGAQSRRPTGARPPPPLQELAHQLLSPILKQQDPALQAAACVTLGALLSLTDGDQHQQLGRALDLALDSDAVDVQTTELLRSIRLGRSIALPANSLQLRTALGRALGRALAATPRIEAELDARFGGGLGQLRFGASPTEVGAQVGAKVRAQVRAKVRALPARTSSGALLPAREFSQDVSYMWTHLAQRPGDLLEALGLESELPLDSAHCVFLFRDERLLRVSFRFFSGRGHEHLVLGRFMRAQGWSPGGERVVVVGQRAQLFGAAIPGLGTSIDLATADGPLPSPVHGLELFVPARPRRPRGRWRCGTASCWPAGGHAS